MGGMNLDPTCLRRLSDGDVTALDSEVTFTDGTVKRLADCNAYDVRVMKAWADFKIAEASAREEELLAYKRPHLRAVPA